MSTESKPERRGPRHSHLSRQLRGARGGGYLIGPIESMLSKMNEAEADAMLTIIRNIKEDGERDGRRRGGRDALMGRIRFF